MKTFVSKLVKLVKNFGKFCTFLEIENFCSAFRYIPDINTYIHMYVYA